VRPVELILARHALKPLKQSLVARGIASELVLDALTEAEVADYLASRLGGHPVDPALPPALHRRTAGNPLFLGAVLGALRAQGALDPADGTWRLSRGLEGLVPESVRQLVARQLGDGAPLEREVLEAASVMGVDFAVAPVAAAAGQSPEVVEEVCARLAQEGRLLAASGVAAWPDGTVSGRYEFLHALYREGVLQRLSPARARQLHGAVGACIEAGHAGREADVAAVLAAHFAEGGEPERARHYHALAADGARGRHADREVILHLDAALTLLQGEPETPERALTELTFHLQLGAANFAVRGYASAEARAHYARARDLAERVEAPASYMEATAGLYTGHAMGGELRQARALAEDLVALAARTPAALFTVVAHTTHGSACFNLGDFPAARASFTRVDEVWSPELPRLVIDQTVLYRSMQALVLLHLGEETAGAEWSRRALAYAADLDDPFNRAWAHSLAAQYAATAGNRDVAREHAEIAVTLASEHGFPVHHASASVPLGWALRDPARIAAGMEAYAGVGQRVARSFQLALLAEVCLEAGDVAAARAALEEALRFAADTGEARHLAELHRLRAECQWRQGAGAGEVEGELRHAAAIGCQQGAGLWERRAAASLARFLDGQKRTARRARRPATS
jgi:tetratricopeptide (TPR) repeat protein